MTEDANDPKKPNAGNPAEPQPTRPAGGVIPPKLPQPPDVPDEEESLYDITRLNKYFAVSAIALLACVLWAFISDYKKPYKDIMRQAHRIDEALFMEQLVLATANVADQLEAARTGFAAETEHLENDDQYQELLETRRTLNTDVDVKTTEYNGAKALYDIIVSQKAGPGKNIDPATDPEIVTARKEREQTLIAKEESEEALRALDEKIRGAKTALLDYRKKINSLSEEQIRLEKRIAETEPSLVNIIRETPGFEFIAPITKIRQTIVEGLDYDLHFAMAKRIDRCQTCHFSIDKAGYDDTMTVALGDGSDFAMTEPYLSHPRLELYVGAESPHKMSEFGCTACHAGRGRALEFSRVAHTPNDLSGQTTGQREKWEDELGWHELKHWEFPMLPKEHIEASCYKCHKEIVDIPQAESLTTGWRLFREVGCFGCHKIEGFEELPKVGPDLTHLSQKTNPDWARKWIKDPRGFRPTTKMPHFFGQTNNDSDELKARADTEIGAMVAFLWDQSNDAHDQLTYPPDSMPAGDLKAGEKVFETRGCMACHRLGSTELERLDRHGNEFGPDLANLGSKVSPEWLRQWVRNPSNYFKESRMPNLRLSDQEIADVAAYLHGQTDTAFEQKPSLELDPTVRRQLLQKAMATSTRTRMTEGGGKTDVTDEQINAEVNTLLATVAVGDELNLLEQYTLDEIALGYKRQKQIFRTAAADVAGMTLDQKKHFVGERLISRYGCAGCHTIPGFEKASRIGTELTKEGAKDMHKFDFGYQLKKENPTVKHNRLSWIYNKLKNPRIYDEGTIKEPEELLKMPNFNFTDDEARHMVTFVAALTGEDVSKEFLSPRPPNNSPDQIAHYSQKMAINKGRKLLMKYNCIACHSVGVFEKRLENNVVKLYDEEEDEEVDTFPLLEEGMLYNYWLAHDLSVTIPANAEEEREEQALTFAEGDFVVDIVKELQKNGLEWKDFTEAQKHLDLYGWREGAVAKVVQENYRRETGEELTQSELLKRTPPPLKGQGGKVYSQWLQEFLKNPERLRPRNTLKLVMPTFPLSPTERRELAEYFSVLAGELYPTEPVPTSEPLSEVELAMARSAIGTCIKCHASGDPSTYTADTIAPSLTYTKSRLKHSWLNQWLVDPGSVVPGTVMPPGLFLKDRGLQSALIADGSGVTVTAVRAGSSLALAGLQVNDRVMKVAGQSIKKPRALLLALADHNDGDTLEVTFVRGDMTQTASVTLVPEDRWVLNGEWPAGMENYNRDHRELMIRYLMEFTDAEGEVLRTKKPTPPTKPTQP